MKFVFWLVPDSVAGRPGPRKEPWSVSEIRAAGFETVLNLSDDESDRDALAAAGIQVFSVPLPTDIPPTEESEKKCEEALPRALGILAQQVEAGRRVLVHCYAGQDRTGMLLALWLATKEKISAIEAIAKVREVRPAAITTLGWETMALRVLPRILSAA